MAITTTTVLTKPIRALYNAAALEGFNEKGQFWKSATVREVSLGESIGKGNPVVFDIFNSGTASTAPLDETSDGSATSLALDQVSVSLQEYGDFVQTSRKLRDTHYGEAEEHSSWMMGQMASDTLDLLARASFDAQSGATWNDFAGSNSAVGTITKGDVLTAQDVRESFAKLRGLNVPTLEGGYYLCYIHPHTLKDLKEETGNASWVLKELYAGERIQPIRDEVGTFEGFRFVLTTNSKVNSKAGSPTSATTSAVSADVYTTYFVGQDAVGFARSGNVPDVKISQPSTGPSDAFGRHQIISWYALCGFGALRDDSLFKFQSSSSMAVNGT